MYRIVVRQTHDGLRYCPERRRFCFFWRIFTEKRVFGPLGILTSFPIMCSTAEEAEGYILQEAMREERQRPLSAPVVAVYSYNRRGRKTGEVR